MRVLKGLLMLFPLLFQLAYMPIIQSISNRYKLYVPTVLSGFVPSDKQDRGSSRIKRIQDTVRFPGMLNSQFSHVAML